MATTERGFTLFELTITISIMVIIGAIVMVNFPGLNREIAAERAAQDISLALRGAQARALGVQKFASTDQFPQGYGVFFDLDANTQYIIFADINEDGLYGVGEAVDTITLPPRLVITSLLAKQQTVPPGAPYQKLHIVFYRPDPTIMMTGVASGVPQNLGAGDVEIVVGAPGETTSRTVVAWSTGQVSVGEQ